MIRYRTSRRKLEQVIESVKPGWLKRAAEKTGRVLQTGRIPAGGAIWREIKPVYMNLQGRSKCAFCERKLEAETYGRGELAVEHFRPKGRVEAWPVPGPLQAEKVVAAVCPRGHRGYPHLAYDVMNYAAACNPCNSGLKRSYFPIEGKYDGTGAPPEKLSGERPLLLFPLGTRGDDPERLIRFHGISPYAVARSGRARRAALVTIEFFQLDNLSRKNLLRERAMVLVALHPALVRLAGGGDAAALAAAEEIADGLTADWAPHANCARSFRRLHALDPASTEELFRGAAALLASSS